MRLLVLGLCVGALVATSVALAAGTEVFSLRVEGSELRVQRGHPSGDVGLWLAPPEVNPPGNSNLIYVWLCQNSDVDVGLRSCSDAPGRGGYLAFERGQTLLRAEPVTAGRYEAWAATKFYPLKESNVVRFTVKDECGWIGVRGPGLQFPEQPPVLAGAPYPCTGWLRSTVPLELRSVGGGLLSLRLSRRVFFDAAWDDPTIPELPPIPNLRIELADDGPSSGRLRYRTGRELQSHVIRAQTYSVLVVSRGRNDIELVQERKATRVRVRRGAAVLVPVTHKTSTTSFDIIQYIHRRCRARPFLACASAIRVKRRRNTQFEYMARSTVVRAGQTRTIVYKAP